MAFFAVFSFLFSSSLVYHAVALNNATGKFCYNINTDMNTSVRVYCMNFFSSSFHSPD